MSAVDTTHECPAPGCTARVQFDRFACPQHWYKLPSELRSRMWRAWTGSDMDAHARVRAECVAYLEGVAA